MQKVLCQTAWLVRGGAGTPSLQIHLGTFSTACSSVPSRAGLCTDTQDRFTERLRHLSRGAGTRAGAAAGTGVGDGGSGRLQELIGRSQTTGLGSWPEVEAGEMPSPLAFAAGVMVDSVAG